MIAFFLGTLGSLFSVVNPLGAVPMYLTLTADHTRSENLVTARKTSLYFASILLVFFFAGTLILNFFGISLDALRIAGGLIIVNSGYGLLNSKFEERRMDKEMRREAVEKDDISFTPMAMPMLSGPGSISLLIGLYAANPTWDFRMSIVAVVLVMALLVYLTLRTAPALFRVLGKAGLAALSRIMGFLVMGIGIQMLIYGLIALAREMYEQVPG